MHGCIAAISCSTKRLQDINDNLALSELHIQRVGEITGANRVLTQMFGLDGLPILSTVPRSGTWFLRYAISFLCHLERGGRIDDRITGSVIGQPCGPTFDFRRFKGGPLFNVSGSFPSRHLFIGHTVCPGFGMLGRAVGWWRRTSFHVPGYDYLHEGLNYRYTPVDLAPYDYTPVRVPTLERAARKGKGRRIVFVYRNPLSQATSFFRYCQNHADPTYSVINGRPLSGVPFQSFLFDLALPSYAKQFISYQMMAAHYPTLVRLVRYERLMAKPIEVLASILDHLSGTQRDWPMLENALWLARAEHLKAIEKELGRSLDGTRNGHGSHMWQPNVSWLDSRIDHAMRRDATALLRQLGIDTDLFEWPIASRAATAA
jgi:hypothetical protein